MTKYAVPFLFIIVSLTWGTTWIAMKYVAPTITSIFSTGMRFTLTAPLLILIAIITNNKLLFPKGKLWWQIYVSVFYFSIPFCLMLYGEIYISAGLASIVFSSMPAFVLFYSMLSLKTTFNKTQVVGLLFSVISLIAVITDTSGFSPNESLKGVVSLLVAVIMHAVMYVECKKRLSEVSVVSFNALPCLISGVALMTLGWFIEHPVIKSPDENEVTLAFLAIMYLGIIAGVGGIVSYFKLQQLATPFLASLVFLVFPVVTIFIENILSESSLPDTSYKYLACLSMGLLLVLLGNKRRIAN